MNPQSNSARFIVLISSLLFMVSISDTYSSPDDLSHSPEAAFYIVTIIPLTFNALNLLGSLYIFYRTFLRWKYDYDKIALLSVRFPFYIAITVIIIIDFSYTASNVSALVKDENIVWPSPYCEILGFFNTTFTLLNMLLVGGISIMTWLRVVQEYYFNWGKYDYKVWLPIVFLSFIFPLISIHEFGAQKYWCGIIDENSSKISTFLLIIIILTLVTIVLCYVHVLKTIHDVKEDNLSVANSEVIAANTVQHNNLERKILRKVLTYILVFIFQYIPFLLSDIFQLLKIQHILLNAISLAAISIGGISNFIQYIRNERFVIFPQNSTSSNNNINLEEREQTKSLS